MRACRSAQGAAASPAALPHSLQCACESKERCQRKSPNLPINRRRVLDVHHRSLNTTGAARPLAAPPRHRPHHRERSRRRSRRRSPRTRLSAKAARPARRGARALRRDVTRPSRGPRTTSRPPSRRLRAAAPSCRRRRRTGTALLMGAATPDRDIRMPRPPLSMRAPSRLVHQWSARRTAEFVAMRRLRAASRVQFLYSCAAGPLLLSSGLGG